MISFLKLIPLIDLRKLQWQAVQEKPKYISRSKRLIYIKKNWKSRCSANQQQDGLGRLVSDTCVDRRQLF